MMLSEDQRLKLRREFLTKNKEDMLPKMQEFMQIWTEPLMKEPWCTKLLWTEDMNLYQYQGMWPEVPTITLQPDKNTSQELHIEEKSKLEPSQAIRIDLELTNTGLLLAFTNQQQLPDRDTHPWEEEDLQLRRRTSKSNSNSD